MKILYIAFKCYNDILEGGGLANKRNLDILNSLAGEKNVTPFYVHNPSESSSIMQYIGNGLRMLKGYHNGLTSAKIHTILDMAPQYDSVFISTSVLGIIAKKLKESGYKGKIISHFHNIERYYYAAALPWYHPLRPLFIYSADKNDKLACTYSDICLTLTQRDSDLLCKLYNCHSPKVFPISLPDNLSYVPDLQKLTHIPPHLLFIGSYFKANSDGLLWFINNVLPQVDAHLTIVGKNMDKLSQVLQPNAKLEIIANAPSLETYYQQADAIILPIFSGSGMKVKTCEALMHGCNIFATDEAIEGYDLDKQKMGAHCNTAQEFIAAIQSLQQNKRPVFNSYNRNIYLSRFTPEKSYDQFIHIINS